MKNLLIPIFLFLSLSATAQIVTIPTPKKYAVNSGKCFFEGEYQMARYWYVIHLSNGQAVYCHKLRCQGDDYTAVFEVKEMPTGKIIQKELTYKNSEVDYTSVLR
jgi:hypothetical protein